MFSNETCGPQLRKMPFRVFYQPLINLQTQKVTAFEALMRWQHPERGLIPPSEFIPLAEEMGLIVRLGEWAMREACSEAMGWPDEYPFRSTCRRCNSQRAIWYRR